ncbi:AAA family ATPase [Leifsonia shinshuensis]|uniref:AAA family ATPase n=1 Tax=Leifsonia shinshuensis TaxID=150026 RepID=UPI00285E8BF2|nr:AAA family ATPase [Leifsonia shinshuensis]MDR6970348.1 putative ATPase [Leifsonia shinshuensis]
MSERGDRFDDRPVRRIRTYADAAYDPDAWPADIPAVRQLLHEGLELPAGVTMLVGENGAGKSTIVEAVAVAYGLPPEGGSNQGRHVTRPTESPLSEWIFLERAPWAAKWGFFLRAETMHGYYSYFEDVATASDPRFHEMSHGESFNTLLATRLNHPQFVAGLVCLDEPEAALSFQSTLAWLANLDVMAKRGTQVLCATHSPILAALPGAHLLELGEWGIRETAYEDLEIVQHYRSFLDAPGRYLRHLL